MADPNDNKDNTDKAQDKQPSAPLPPIRQPVNPSAVYEANNPLLDSQNAMGIKGSQELRSAVDAVTQGADLPSDLRRRM